VKIVKEGKRSCRRGPDTKAQNQQGAYSTWKSKYDLRFDESRLLHRPSKRRRG